MNLYISRFSDGVLFSYSTVYKKNGHRRRRQGGGWQSATISSADICPRLKSQPGCKSFFHKFLYTNWLVRIHTIIQIDQYEFIQLYKLYYKFIQLYKLYSTNSYNSYIFYTNCILRIHTTTRARSVSREGEARAARAKPKPRGRSPSTPPAPTRPHPAAPTLGYTRLPRR